MLEPMGKSPSTADIHTISSIQSTVQHLAEQWRHQEDGHASESVSLPQFNETHFDINGDVSSAPNSIGPMQSTPTPPPALTLSNINLRNEYLESKKEILFHSLDYDEDGGVESAEHCSISMIGMGGNGKFLDTKMMSNSASANYYRPTEEPEPLDLTQLNIEASVMCLVSKVKFLCGRCGSPAVRLRQPKQAIKRSFLIQPPDVVTKQPANNCVVAGGGGGENTKKELNLALLSNAVGEVTRKVAATGGNKFTEGLDLSQTTDWASELRPSMRKLRQAMDGLLKTARLVHSVQRLQQDTRRTTANLATMFRRDVCFSQAVSK